MLRGLSFHARAGTLTALVGPSGAGKTTITHLVPRLYDATSGTVRIGGHDVRDLTLTSLRDTIGVVTQDAHLFHETVRANLEYARPGASERELVEVCEAALIWDTISALPDGLDTVVGERGYRFSGGEKQRLALARLLLKAPPIVVLDEATAHLDSESEAAIQRALKTALAGRTSLVIAHRLSTIREADQILVVEAGRIRESGSHDKLLAEGGLYADLYRSQFAHQAMGPVDPEVGGPMASTSAPPINLVEPGLYSHGDPFAQWRWLRANDPVHWHPPGELPGFWALTRYADVKDAYLDHETFSSARGILLRPDEHGADPGGGRTLALTDPPRHRMLRGLVDGWFTVRSVRALEAEMADIARGVVDRALEVGGCDFVTDVAARVPLYVICRMMGVPEADWEHLYTLTSQAFAGGDALTRRVAHLEILGYFEQLRKARAAEPGDDLVSRLATADVEGAPLDPRDVILNCDNLFVGGTENTASRRRAGCWRSCGTRTSGGRWWTTRRC